MLIANHEWKNLTDRTTLKRNYKSSPEYENSIEYMEEVVTSAFTKNSDHTPKIGSCHVPPPAMCDGCRLFLLTPFFFERKKP